MLEQDGSAMDIALHPKLGSNAGMLVTQAVMALLQQVPESVTGSSKLVALVLGCLPALWPSSSSSLGN